MVVCYWLRQELEDASFACLGAAGKEPHQVTSKRKKVQPKMFQWSDKQQTILRVLEMHELLSVATWTVASSPPGKAICWGLWVPRQMTGAANLFPLSGGENPGFQACFEPFLASGQPHSHSPCSQQLSVWGIFLNND